MRVAGVVAIRVARSRPVVARVLGALLALALLPDDRSVQ